MIFQRRRHNKKLLLAHLIFVTKYRKRLFLGSFREDIKQCVFDICKSRHWYVKAMETDKDHLHLLLQFNPTDSITNIVSTIKQQSAYYMWRMHEDFLQQHYWRKKILWSDGYFAASIGQVSKETIEQYIRNQE